MTPLAAGSITRRRNLTAQQVEQWNARSADGVWDYERLEDAATTWRVTHLPTGRHLLAASLPYARAITADGRALAQLDERDTQATRLWCAHRGGWTGTPCPEPATAGTEFCTRHGAGR